MRTTIWGHPSPISLSNLCLLVLPTELYEKLYLPLPMVLLCLPESPQKGQQSAINDDPMTPGATPGSAALKHMDNHVLDSATMEQESGMD